MNDLIADWRDYLVTDVGGLHLADASHPLQIFIGSTDSGAPRMVIRSAARPTKPTLSGIVLVERYEDNTGKWNLSFTLQDRKFDEVFLRLTDDLCSRSSGSVNEQMALDRVGLVFDEWRRLLKPRTFGLLSMEELRGLVGEIWLILNRFAESRGMEAAVEGWLGPMGLPQDFWHDGEGYCEAKAIGPSTTRVKISSEHQLDIDELLLIVLRIANTDEGTVGSFNLPTLVTRVRAGLGDLGVSADSFDERLARLGVELTEAFYRDTWFALVGGTVYDVAPGFPRVIASRLASGISRVSYQLELAEIHEYVSGEIEP